jgi:hypothetical protein
MNHKKTAVLFSAGSFGVSIPALLLFRQLAQKGIRTELFILEDVFHPEKREELVKIKNKYREDFRFALAAQSLTRDISKNFSPRRVSALYGEWERKHIQKFIAFSGFWIPLLRGFAERGKAEHMEAVLCHMDSVPSTSFKPYHAVEKVFTHHWFFEWQGNHVHSFIGTGNNRPLPFSERDKRCVIHGGGGGLGTYRDKLPELDKAGLALDIISGNREEAYALCSVLQPVHRHFFTDPVWNPLIHEIKHTCLFPPLREIVKEQGKDRLWRHNEYHMLHQFISRSCAVISKPGGMTLMDSLRTATPLVILEPYGDYEEKNGRLWQNLGFGILYDKWLDTHCSFSVLEKLHRNLLSVRETIKNYTEILTEEIVYAG